MTFYEEVILLCKTYEEEENAQKVLLRAEQIEWDGCNHTLDKLYSDIKLAWLMISPGADMTKICARQLIKLITERNFKLGAYLQEQVDRKLLQLNDFTIFKESEAWLNRDALVRSSQHQFNSGEFRQLE